MQDSSRAVAMQEALSTTRRAAPASLAITLPAGFLSDSSSDCLTTDQRSQLDASCFVDSSATTTCTSDCSDVMINIDQVIPVSSPLWTAQVDWTQVLHEIGSTLAIDGSRLDRGDDPGGTLAMQGRLVGSYRSIVRQAERSSAERDCRLFIDRG